MTRLDFEYIKDAFSQIIDDIAGNPDWHDATRAVASDIGTLEKLLEKRVVELPNDLEEAAWEYAPDLPSYNIGGGYLPPQSRDDLRTAFKDGAKWQAEQFEKNRLASCDNMSEEEYDRETDFVDSIIKKEHHQPTFSDAINYGMRLQKEQMMREAVEYEVGMHGEPITINLDKYVQRARGIFPGDKIKLIIVKED